MQFPLRCVQCSSTGCRAPFRFPECGCSAHAVDAESHKVDAVCCDGRYRAHDCEGSETAVIAVHLQFHFSWIQSPCSCCTACCPIPERGCSAHARAAVSLKVDAVCCDRGCSAHEGGCSDPAVVEVPHAGSLNENAVPLQWIQCPTRWMQYANMDDALPMKVHAVFLYWLLCPLLCP